MCRLITCPPNRGTSTLSLSKDDHATHVDGVTSSWFDKLTMTQGGIMTLGA
jgi:hypothetical protein